MPADDQDRPSGRIEKREKRKRWLKLLLGLHPATRWAYRIFRWQKFTRDNQLIVKARTVRRLRRIIKLVRRYQDGELKVLARISKLVAAVVGVAVSWVVMKVPFIAAMIEAADGVTVEGIAAAITTLIITGISVYFSPKNAD